MKRTIPILGLILLTSMAYAHEFWLQPLTFLLKRNERAKISLMVGEDYTGERVTMSGGRVLTLKHYYGNEKEDLGKAYLEDSISQIEVKLRTPGGHLIVFNSNNKSIALEPGKFNDYLRSEGLDHISALRTTYGDTMKPGREVYQRCVKTLLQVENKYDTTYKAVTGIKLEIIPLQNPYQIKNDAEVRFKIRYNNHALANSLVLAWHTENGKTIHTTQRSDQKGDVTFRISASGKWMISVVHMVPHQDKTEADWQSYWSSYTFGYY